MMFLARRDACYDSCGGTRVLHVRAPIEKIAPALASLGRVVIAVLVEHGLHPCPMRRQGLQGVERPDLRGVRVAAAEPERRPRALTACRVSGRRHELVLAPAAQ